MVLIWNGIPVMPHLGSMPISTTPCRQIGSVLLDLLWWVQLNFVNNYALNTVLGTPYIYCVLSNLGSTKVASWRNPHNKLGGHRSWLHPVGWVWVKGGMLENWITCIGIQRSNQKRDQELMLMRMKRVMRIAMTWRRGGSCPRFINWGREFSWGRRIWGAAQNWRPGGWSNMAPSDLPKIWWIGVPDLGILESSIGVNGSPRFWWIGVQNYGELEFEVLMNRSLR